MQGQAVDAGRGRRAVRRIGGETGHTFLFTLNEQYVIDANQRGNTARWINHSCAPNCRAVVEESASGDPRRDKVMIEAIRAIKPGEELTYDYGIVLDVPHTAPPEEVVGVPVPELRRSAAAPCSSPSGSRVPNIAPILAGVACRGGRQHGQ
ncbi:SET domain-containing protein [Rhodanobacter lindaniclasticus]